jgi:hypothetical protein
MEDDATRTTSPRSKSARPPAALFMEPKAPPARPDAEPDDREPEPGGGSVPEAETRPEPGTRSANGTRPSRATPRPAKDEPTRAAKDESARPAGDESTRPAGDESTRPAGDEPGLAVEDDPVMERPAERVDQPVPPPRKATARVATAEPKPAKATRAAKKAAPRRTEAMVESLKTEPRKATPEKAPWWTRTPTRLGAVPGYLAEAAVDTFGDEAHRYVQWLRETYPNATPDGLARAAAGKPKGLTVLAGPVGLLAAQARLVLRIAAAYGQDPRDAARVPELLVLLSPKRLAGPLLARMSGRLLPGAGLVAGALTDAGVLERTAHRAIAYYSAGAANQ